VELAKEKQVFITTHDQGLLELLQGCETLYLRKKDGFTTIVNKK
jgi:predicted ATPase